MRGLVQAALSGFVATQAGSRPVDAPMALLRYDTKDITADISPFLIKLTYTDNLEGESDALDVQLEDVDGRWISAWYPGHGDTLHAQIGFAGSALLDCGEFEIDEIELQGPPDTATIKALSAGIKRSVRTRHGRQNENTTLQAIAADVAKRNQLEVSGTIEAVSIQRVTQVFESDLAFLRRISDEYGHAFNVRGNKLVFFQTKLLREGKPVYIVTRQDCASSYRLRDKVHGVVGEAEATWFDPREKKRRVVSVKDKAGSSNRASADKRRINVRAETDAQARQKAQAQLDKNDDQTGATLTLYGNPLLVAGVTLDLQTFGKFDGRYLVVKSVHRLSRSGGYVTEVDLKRVRA